MCENPLGLRRGDRALFGPLKLDRIFSGYIQGAYKPWVYVVGSDEKEFISGAKFGSIPSSVCELIPAVCELIPAKPQELKADDKVWVRDCNSQKGHPRHFHSFDDNASAIMTFENGCTSHSTDRTKLWYQYSLDGETWFDARTHKEVGK